MISSRIKYLWYMLKFKYSLSRTFGTPGWASTRRASSASESRASPCPSRQSSPPLAWSRRTRANWCHTRARASWNARLCRACRRRRPSGARAGWRRSWGRRGVSATWSRTVCRGCHARTRTTPESGSHTSETSYTVTSITQKYYEFLFSSTFLAHITKCIP